MIRYTTKTKKCHCRQLKKQAVLTLTYKIEKVKGKDHEIFEKLECDIKEAGEVGKRTNCTCDLERLFEIGKLK